MENPLVDLLVEVFTNQIWQKCQTFTLQQSHLLRRQHKRIFRSFLTQCLRHSRTRTGNLGKHFVTWSEWVKHFYPKNVYELKKTLLGELGAVQIPYKNEQKMFEGLLFFDFESTSVKGKSS